MRTERLAATYDLDVAITHFPLHPETPPEGLTLEDLFAGLGYELEMAKEDMRRRMELEGLPYGPRTHTYNSRLAQELAAWAVTQPGGDAIHDALFRAYFVDGVNLAAADRLVAVAERVGLPPEVAAVVLTDRSFRSVVDEHWNRSRTLGVTGVPTFVIGDRAVVGAQPYELLTRFAEAMGAERRSG